MLNFYVFVLGIIAGSILKICIELLSKHKSIFAQLSCSRCKARFQIFDLIPLISYLSLRGRCRYCGFHISLRKPFIELLTGLLFVLCLYAIVPSIHLVKALALTCFLIVVSIIDYDYSLIYDNVLIPMAVIGVAVNLFIGDIKTLNMLIAALLGGSIFLMLAIVSKGGFGGGDIKFMACIGLWLGLKFTILAVLLSFIFGGLGAAILLLLKKKTIADKFPYGPYIAIASFITLLYGDSIVAWYWNWAFQVK